MILKKQTDIPQTPVTKANSKKTFIQILIGPEDGAPHYIMRRFEIQGNGEIGLHDHPEEHEIYILSGQVEVFNDQGERYLAKANDVLYVPPYEKHGYKNPHPTESVYFICVIPILKE